MLAVFSACYIALSGKSPPTAEASPVILTVEEMAEMEKRNKLRLKIKEEHLAALQFEGNSWKELRWYFSVENGPVGKQPRGCSNCVYENTKLTN